MERSGARSFLDLDGAELTGRVDAAGIPQCYRAGVLENLRMLHAHARRVAEALAADPCSPDAASSRPSKP